MQILFEDEHILAVDKPAGLMVHGDGRQSTPHNTSKPVDNTDRTVADWFLENYPESSGVGEPPIETQSGETIFRPGIVHRLDRDTSGVMLLAKTNTGHAHLKKQFMDRTITKTYHALTYGHLKHDQYHIDAPIGRARNFGRWTAIPKAMRGTSREAQTDIAVLKRFEHNSQLYTYVTALPKTGRTHQIRVHLQYLSYPIVADTLYAGKRNDLQYNLGLNRHALHAHEIQFSDLAEKKHAIHAELPTDFGNAILC